MALPRDFPWCFHGTFLRFTSSFHGIEALPRNFHGASLGLFTGGLPWEPSIVDYLGIQSNTLSPYWLEGEMWYLTYRTAYMSPTRASFQSCRHVSLQ